MNKACYHYQGTFMIKTLVCFKRRGRRMSERLRSNHIKAFHGEMSHSLRTSKTMFLGNKSRCNTEKLVSFIKHNDWLHYPFSDGINYIDKKSAACMINLIKKWKYKVLALLIRTSPFASTETVSWLIGKGMTRPIESILRKAHSAHKL